MVRIQNLNNTLQYTSCRHTSGNLNHLLVRRNNRISHWHASFLVVAATQNLLQQLGGVSDREGVGWNLHPAGSPGRTLAGSELDLLIVNHLSRSSGDLSTCGWGRSHAPDDCNASGLVSEADSAWITVKTFTEGANEWWRCFCCHGFDNVFSKFE